MNQMGETSFEELKKKQEISTNQSYNRLVQCITSALLVAMDKNPADWEVKVFVDDSPNAFALPGNHVGVHTGMIKLVGNKDQLAAVIGHEIGHVLANHGNERVSQNLVVQGGLVAANIALGQSSSQNGMILGALGLGAQFGVLLPFSRSHESEADSLGLKYMAKAGFDPRQAPELWKKMREASGGKTPPEFLSTHPSPSTRIKKLSEEAPQYLDTYRRNKGKNSC